MSELSKAVTIRNHQIRRLKNLWDVIFDKWVNGDIDEETYDRKFERIFWLVDKAERRFQEQTGEYKEYWY